MLPSRVLICLVAACCAIACGDRPELPGPTTPNSSESDRMNTSPGGGDAVTVLESEQRPPPSESVQPEPSSSPDEAPPPGADDDVVQETPEPLGPDVSIAACTVLEMGCVRFYIAVADSDAETCLQLVLDDCNETTRRGLAVDLPLSWRFGTGFVGDLTDECAPNTAFVAADASIVSGSGSISWNEDTRQPSEVVIDVTLVPSSSAADVGPISISNSDLVDPVPECDG
jgi:hypothetical protein